MGGMGPEDLGKTYNVGPPNDSVQLVYNLVNSMVYGGYNELVNGFINQHTHNYGAPHCGDFSDGFVEAFLRGSFGVTNSLNSGS